MKNKKKIIVMLMGVLAAGMIGAGSASAASQGNVTMTYTVQQANVVPGTDNTPNAVIIDKGGNQVQTGDTSSSAWIYTLAGAASLLAMVWILLGKRRKEEEDDGKEIVES